MNKIPSGITTVTTKRKRVPKKRSRIRPKASNILPDLKNKLKGSIEAVKYFVLQITGIFITKTYRIRILKIRILH
jgi:hypothetical protein